MKSPLSLFVLVLALVGNFATSAFATSEGRFTYPLGPIGGVFSLISDTNNLRIVSLQAGAPGAVAGLQENDLIFGAYGTEFSTLGSHFQGVVRELGEAIDRAESTDGQLPLTILRPGTGTTSVTVSLPVLGPLGPAYTITSTKYAATYEYACAQLHQRIMDDNDGDVGHPTGFVGMALLGHPNWADTTGDKPYRLSINRIRDITVNRINNAVYAPVEDLLLDGSDNPNFVGEPEGLASWALGMGVMFIAEYYTKTGDPDVADEVQRGAELMANRFQWWKQPALHANGYSPGFEQIAGMVSHGGVTGDYIHGGWGGGINMVGVHLFSGLAMAKRAGADMTVRPKDGHYFGYETAPVDAVPAGMENYDHTLDEKFQMGWDWLVKSSRNSPGTIDDGSIGYTISQGGSPYDAGGRVPGGLLGMGVYHDGVIADADDADRWERQKGYVARNHDRHMSAHAYNLGGTAFQALAMPFLSDRQQRYIQHNWKFYYNFSREPDNSLTFFHDRAVDESYQNLPLVVLVNAALPRSVARGGLPHIPGFDTNRIFAHFKTYGMTWPKLEAREMATQTAELMIEADAMDTQGDVMVSGTYTAAWSLVSGPSTNVVFGDSDSAATTVTFPESGQYQVQLALTSGTKSVTEPIDVDVQLASLPTGWTAGKANYEVFTGLSGSAIGDLTSAPKYINETPDITRTVSAMEGDHGGDSYGTRLTGYLIPPVTGDYTFHIASDDTSQVAINTTASTGDLVADASGANVIASVPTWAGQYEWDKFPAQTSVVIALTANERYYYQILHKEGGGGDHVAVAWTRPGTATIEVVGGAYLAIPPTSGAVAAAIVTQPTDQAAALGENVTFTLEAEGPDPKSFQWRLNGVSHWPPNPSPALALTNVGGGYEGTFECVCTIGDTVIVSDPVTLTFTDPTFGDLIAGGLWREVYTGIGGDHVSALTSSDKFPFLSDSSGVITSAESPDESLANNFGSRWSGWVIPTETASYRFYLTANTSAELWLSVDELESHKRLISSRPSSSGSKAWTSVTPSEWISLQAGQRYFIELLHKEGNGSEHAAVAWQKQGDPALVNGDPAIPGAFLQYRMGGKFVDGATAPFAIDDSLGVPFGQDNTLDVIANDLDSDFATLAIQSVSPSITAHGGTVTFSGSTVTYTPAADFTGTDSFTYTVLNSQGLTDTGTVNITMVDISHGLQGWWRVDEGSGTHAVDVSGSKRHGTIEGGPVWKTPSANVALDKYLEFDGVDDSVDVGELNAVLGTTASLSFWLRTTQPGQAQGSSTSQAVFGYDARWWESDIKWGVMDSAGHIGLWLENDNEWVGSKTVVNDGQWRHVVLTRDQVSTEMQVFVDGVFEGNALGVDTAIAYSFSTIGRINSNDGAGAWFKGDLDDIRIYDKVLSKEDAQAIHSYRPLDDDPVAIADAVTTAVAQPAVILPLNNDEDAVHPSLTITGTTTPANGMVTLTDDDTLTYTSSAGFSGIDQFDYSIQDGTGNTSTATISVDVFNPDLGMNLWYKFNKGSGTQALDVSGNLHHGAIADGTWSMAQTGGGLTFDGANDYIEIPPAAVNGLSNEVTVAFCSYGDAAILPKNTSIFEADDTSGNRTFNIHFPWNNSQIYWDAGNSGTGSTDRIQKVATEAEFEGAWQHWAFTKNAVTGDLAIYLNGTLWHSGTGRARTIPAVLSKARIGSIDSGSNHWAGQLDEFRLYDRALTAAEVAILAAHTATNTAPQAIDDTTFAAVGQTTAIDVLDNDVDDDWTTLQITNVTSPIDGSASVSVHGRSIEFTAPANSAVLHVTYTIQDAFGKSSTADLTIQVSNNPGLQAWWKLDDSSLSPVRDDSGNDYHATQLHGVVTGQAGAIDNAYSFDGGSQHVTVPALTGIGTTNTVTITGWVKVKDEDGERPDDWSAVYSNYNGPTFNISSSLELKHHWSSSAHWGWSSGLILPSDQWALVAMAVEPTQAVFYLHDGTLASATRTTAYPEVSFDNTGSFGRHANLWHRNFKGLLDDVRVYDRTLTQTDVEALYIDRLKLEIALTLPTGLLIAPADVTLSATVVSNGQSIDKVAFYDGVTLIAEDATAPYSVAYNGVTEGNHSITARVVYNTSSSIDTRPSIMTVNAAVPTGYQTWAGTTNSLTGNDALMMADPDGDGLANLLEYAIGGQPNTYDEALLPRFDDSTGMKMKFNLNTSATDIMCKVERSIDMETFTEIYRRDGTNSSVTIAEGISATIDGQEVTLSDPMMTNTEIRAFYQLVIVEMTAP